MKISGIKEVKALQLFAGIELCRRVKESELWGMQITSPQDLSDWLQLCYGYAKQEHFIVVFLDQQNRIIHHKLLFLGTLSASMVHPREIYKEAIRQSAASIICVHNHPGGSIRPSQADIRITEQIAQSGKLIGIPLLDHIIVSRQDWFSFRQSELID